MRAAGEEEEKEKREKEGRGKCERRDGGGWAGTAPPRAQSSRGGARTHAVRVFVCVSVEVPEAVAAAEGVSVIDTVLDGVGVSATVPEAVADGEPMGDVADVGVGVAATVPEAVDVSLADGGEDNEGENVSLADGGEDNEGENVCEAVAAGVPELVVDAVAPSVALSVEDDDGVDEKEIVAVSETAVAESLAAAVAVPVPVAVAIAETVTDAERDALRLEDAPPRLADRERDALRLGDVAPPRLADRDGDARDAERDCETVLDGDVAPPRDAERDRDRVTDGETTPPLDAERERDRDTERDAERVRDGDRVGDWAATSVRHASSNNARIAHPALSRFPECAALLLLAMMMAHACSRAQSQPQGCLHRTPCVRERLLLLLPFPGAERAPDDAFVREATAHKKTSARVRAAEQQGAA